MTIVMMAVMVMGSLPATVVEVKAAVTANDFDSLKAELEAASSAVTIPAGTYDGNGGTITLPAGASLSIASNASVTLSNMTIQSVDGYDISGSKINNSGLLQMNHVSVTGKGHGIKNTGKAILVSCDLSENTSGGSGYANAGGAAVNNTGGTLLLDDCSLSHNVALNDGYGGAIYNGTVYANNTVFANNHSDGYAGGAICYCYNTLYLMNCSFVNNSTTKNDYSSGALYNSTTYCVNTIFANNKKNVSAYESFDTEGTVAQLNNTSNIDMSHGDIIASNAADSYDSSNPQVLNSISGRPYGYFVPVKNDGEAYSGNKGVKTFFDYTLSGTTLTVYMGYGNNNTKLGSLNAPSSDKEVTTYFGGATRQAGVVGACGLPYPTVYFNSNGGSSVASQMMSETVTVATEPADPSRDGYTFGGWYTDNGTFENAYSFGTTVTESFTLYAKWTITNPVTITFDANGGSGSMASQTVPRGVATPLNKMNGLIGTDVKPSFDRWNTSPDGNGTPYEDGATVSVTTATTLYAQWTELKSTDDYQVTDITNKVVKLTSASADKLMTALSSPAKTIVIPSSLELTTEIYGPETGSKTIDLGGANQLTVANGQTVTLRNLKVTGATKGALKSSGTTVLKGCWFDSNSCTDNNGFAGGVWANYGTMILDGCSFTDNSVNSTANHAPAGALHVGGNSSVYVNNSVFTGNSATSGNNYPTSGIGVYHGTLRMMNSTVALGTSTDNLPAVQTVNDSGSSYLYAANCIFTGNTGTGADVKRYAGSPNYMGLYHCIYGKYMYNNTETNEVDSSSKKATMKNTLNQSLSTSANGKYITPKENGTAASGGVATYFDYSDLNNIKIGYSTDNGATITALGSSTVPGSSKRVTTCYEGGERNSAVIGASAPYTIPATEINVSEWSTLTSAENNKANTILKLEADLTATTSYSPADGVTIDGNGHTIDLTTGNTITIPSEAEVSFKDLTIDGANASRSSSAVMSDGGILSMENVTIQNIKYCGLYCKGGNAVLKKCRFENNGGTNDFGGALCASNNAVVVLDACSFYNNAARYGGAYAIGVPPGNGDSAAKLYANNCIFDDGVSTNTALLYGNNNATRIYMINCTAKSKSQNYVYMNYGTAYAANCIFMGNGSYTRSGSGFVTNNILEMTSDDGTVFEPADSYYIKDGGSASTGGVATYFDYSDLSNVKMGYSTDGTSVTAMGSLTAPDVSKKVATYYDGGTRVTAHIGACGLSYPIVTFNSNGGSDVASQMIISEDVVVTKPSDPVKDGYAFDGWYSDALLQTSFTGWNSTIAHSITLYAKWNANSYTVTFNKKSGTGGSDSVSAAYGSAMPALASTALPTRTGYNFDGYFDAETNGTKYYNSDGSSAHTWDKTAATTLYAQWTAGTYEVTLDKQSGTGGSNSVTATYAQAMPAATMPTRSGCIFKGYFDATTGGNKYYDSDGTSARSWDKAESTTLYAQWDVDPAVAPTISAQPADLSLTYGYTSGNLSVTALADSGTTYTLSYQWYQNTTDSNTGGSAVAGATAATYTVPTGKSAGTTEYYYCVVTATRTDNNETADTASSVATLTVGKAGISPSVTMTGYTYGGTISVPSVSGNDGNGAVTFYYNTENSSSGGTAFAGVISTSLNAGTYYLYATIGATDNYNGATTAPVAFVIGKGTWTVTTASGAAMPDGSGSVDLGSCLAPGGSFGTITSAFVSDPNSILNGDPSISGNTLSFSFNAQATENQTATVTVPVNDATNYSDYSITVTLTSTNKTAQNLSFADSVVNKTYGDDPFTNTLSGAVTTLTWSSSDTSVATVDENGEVTIIGVGSGSTTISVSAAETDQYLAGSSQFTLNIAARSITIPSAVTGLKYTGSEQTGVAAGTGYTVTNGSATDANNYTATAVLTDTANCKWSDGSVTDKTISWSIGRGDGPAAPTGLAGTAPTSSGGSDGKITGVNAQMEYSTTGSSYTACTGTQITGLAAGNYYVRYAQTSNREAGVAATVNVPDYVAPTPPGPGPGPGPGPDPVVTKYHVTVESGTGSGDYEPGATVRISAYDAPEGKEFDSWTGNVSFADASAITTSFIMPDEDVTVTAVYKDEEPSDCEHRNTELRGVVKATCTEQGYSGDTYCKDCGKLLHKGEVTDIDPDNHSYDDGVVTKEPTILKEGERMFICTRCGHTRTESIPRLDDGEDHTGLIEDLQNEELKLEVDEQTRKNDDGSNELAVIINGQQVEKRIVKDSDVNIVESKIWVSGLRESYPYTGSEIKPAISVYDGLKKLSQGTDYGIRYSDNVDVGSNATIILSFKGDYKDTKQETVGFTVGPAMLGRDLTAFDMAVCANGKIQKPIPSVVWTSTGSKVGKKCFNYSYSKDGKPVEGVGGEGVYYCEISSNAPEYSGTLSVKVTVTENKKLLLSKASVTMKYKKYVYTGGPVVPQKGSYTLKLDGTTLREGIDYEVGDVISNVEPGKATIEFCAVEGNKAGYAGSKSATFTIVKGCELKPADGFTYSYSDSVMYSKSGAQPAVTVRYNGNILKKGVDYTLSYSGNKKATKSKTAVITVKGTGNFKGSVKLYYGIEKQDIDALSSRILVTDKEESKKGYKNPTVTITESDGTKLSSGKDYKIGTDYSGPDKDGWVTVSIIGNGNYTGSTKIRYRYISSSVKLTKVKVNKISNKVYTGKAVVISDEELGKLLYTGKKNAPVYLVPGVDFVVEKYTNNTNSGNAKVTLRGIGAYSGAKNVTFKIVSRNGDYMGALVEGKWKR